MSFAAQFGLIHDAWGRMVLIDADGRRHAGVEPVRAFPITDPSRWVAICDERGKELACIDDVETLPPAVREVLEEQLARREFTPQVRRIVSIVSRNERAQWEVETDRGRTRFQVKGSDDVRRLAAQRISITDEHGVRYLIPDVAALDAASRRLLERYFV